MTAPSLNEI
jgi:hypothetical protein